MLSTKSIVAGISTFSARSVLLKISARGKFYDFHFGTDQNKWLPVLVDVDAHYLSTQVAGGFIGAYFGLYAYSPAEQVSVN